jgi:hypothetical protein
MQASLIFEFGAASAPRPTTAGATIIGTAAAVACLRKVRREGFISRHSTPARRVRQDIRTALHSGGVSRSPLLVSARS